MIAPAPLVLWAIALRYLSRLEGWGALGAAAPILLPILALSGALGVWGLALVWRARRRGEPVTVLALATVAAGALAMYYGFRGLA